MDSVLGIQYDGGVLLAADQSNAAFGILVLQTNLDKIAQLTDSSLLAVSGPNCDMVNFTDYMSKNLQLYKLKNDGMHLSTAAQANFCRSELATALRRGPFQVNCLLGGYDPASPNNASKKEGPSLYWLDYMGTLQKVKYGCQGYAANFCLSIMDREHQPNGLTEEDALKILKMCMKEIAMRFVPSQPNFIIKAVDKDGCRVIDFGSDPADN